MAAQPTGSLNAGKGFFVQYRPNFLIFNEESFFLAIHDVYSKRKKRLQNGELDVYQYESLPEKLKVQIVHIWDGVLDKWKSGVSEHVKTVLYKELGLFKLPYSNVHRNDSWREIVDYFLGESDCDSNLDVVELMMQTIALPDFFDPEDVSEAIGDINARFRESAVGYQFAGGEIIRVDSQLLHKEAVVPAIRLLKDKGFEAAEKEFLKAHEAYRHGDIQLAITECHKAFESAMRSIIERQGWKYDDRPDATDKSELDGKIKANAGRLIDICFRNNLIPSYFETQIKALRSLLESSIPTIRNKNGGHGDGVAIKVVPEYLASFMLHMTASTILFLVEAESAIGR